MKDPTPTLLHPRRIGVTGAFPWKNPGLKRAFCEAVGKTLIERNTVIVTRGGKAGSSTSGRRPVDELVVNAASEVLKGTGRPVVSAIETVIASVNSDRPQFHMGTLSRVHGATYEAERFGFVARLDGLIGISGRGGTKQALILALATERPILPVPTFGGASKEVWDEHQPILADTLGIDEAETNRWMGSPESNDAAAELGAEMVTRFLDRMARRCFVVMPFHESYSALYDFVIEPAVSGLGDKPIRTDRIGVPGDVGRQISEGIQRAEYVIVVLNGLRPNVLYELGLAHGQGKPTILMNRRGSLGTDVVPFDLTLQQRLEYDELDGSLPNRLQDSIRALGRL